MKIYSLFLALMAACGSLPRAQSFQIVGSTLTPRSPATALGVVSEVTNAERLVAAVVYITPLVSFAFGYRNGMASIEREKLEFDRRYEAEAALKKAAERDTVKMETKIMEGMAAALLMLLPFVIAKILAAD
jgi:hypothetical protein